VSVDEIMMNRIWKQRDDLVKENQRLQERITQLEQENDALRADLLLWEEKEAKP
jgi:cell division protein FtsB